MLYEIRHKFTGAVLFSLECGSLKVCVEAAVSSRANLAGAYLTRANLAGAYLADAYLAGAYLTGANLADADLTGANLADADLTGAYLAGANLAGAYLAGAYLADADLTGAKHSELALAKTMICPEGDFIAWKSCRDKVLVKLLIPSDARRSNACGRKCRAEFADVLEVIGADEGKSKNPSGEGEIITYRKGERVKCVKPFDENRWNECAPGIHFYLHRIEAEND